LLHRKPDNDADRGGEPHLVGKSMHPNRKPDAPMPDFDQTRLSGTRHAPL